MGSKKGLRKTKTGEETWRVDVTDPIALAGGPWDYADAFEVGFTEPDAAPPVDWIRAGMAATPKLVDWIARAMSLGESTPASPHEFSGFLIVASTPDLLHLHGEDGLMRTTMIARQVGPTGRRLTTVLRFRRPALTRALWALIAPLHRRTARQLLMSPTPAIRTSPLEATDATKNEGHR